MIENKIKHLEMIENVIQRMGKNCFQLKAWTVTLVTLVGALSPQEADRRFILLAFIPIIAFWILDSYYLQLERKYRILYSNIVKEQVSSIDFKMDIRDIQPINSNEKRRVKIIVCMMSKSELLFYLPIIIAVVVLIKIFW